jgi:hypothetical protein
VSKGLEGKDDTSHSKPLILEFLTNKQNSCLNLAKKTHEVNQFHGIFFDVFHFLKIKF